ncbi:MAG: methyl-accepting chemotaxis signaling domain protein [Massilia sp.]|nr:methyl-accepting chemotaxis signaling domain protein [Massilia sp.]
MKKSGMKIRQRLAAGFGAVFLLMMVLTALAISRVDSIDTSLNRINDVNNVKQRYAINFRGSVHDRAIALRDVVLAADPGTVGVQVALIDKLAGNYAKSAAPLDALFEGRTDTSGDEKSALAAIKESERKTMPLIAKVIALRLADSTAEAGALVAQQAAPAFVDWLASVNRLIDLEEKLNKVEADSARAVSHSFLVWMLVLCAISVAAGTLAAWVISRGLLRQLGGEPDYAVAIAGSIAAGDLAVAIDTRPGDKTSLLFAMQAMRDSLVGIVSQVRAGTATINTASGEIAAGNLDLSARTESQAGTLEETASAMEELTGTVRQNADNARQANVLAMSASEVAVKGGAVVAQVVDTMASINESSKKIVDIIGVIDSIAFQTNILALNAAVEAARAGEQGRGFAIVASEVRNLAQRSAAAAQEIKTLIGSSVERVEMGARLVDQAGSTMQDIVTSVKRVTDIMAEIALASQEQTAGIESVNGAIGQMDEATQQNAALVEQAGAAAASLGDEAATLSRIVSIFKLGDAGPSLPTGALVRRPARAPRAVVPPAQPRLGKTKQQHDEWETF